MKFYNRPKHDNEAVLKNRLGTPIGEFECNIVANDIIEFQIPPIPGKNPEHITHCNIAEKYYECETSYTTLCNSSWTVNAYYSPITDMMQPNATLRGICTRHPTGNNCDRVVDWGGSGTRVKTRLGSGSNYDKFENSMGYVIMTYATSSRFVAKATELVEHVRVRTGYARGGPWTETKEIHTGIFTYSATETVVTPGDTEITSYFFPVYLNQYNANVAYPTINGVSCGVSLTDLINGPDDIAGLPSDQLISATLCNAPVIDRSLVDLTAISTGVINMTCPSNEVISWVAPSGRTIRAYVPPYRYGAIYRSISIVPPNGGVCVFEDCFGRQLAMYDQKQNLTLRAYWDEQGGHVAVDSLEGTTSFDFPAITQLMDQYDIYKARQLEIDRQALDMAISREKTNAVLGAVGGGMNTGVGLAMASGMAEISTAKNAGAKAAIGMKGGVAGFAIGAATSAITSVLNINALREDFALNQKAMANQAHGQLTQGGSYQWLIISPTFSYGFFYIYSLKGQAYKDLAGVAILTSGNFTLESGYWQGDFDFTGYPRPALLAAQFLKGVRIVQ